MTAITAASESCALGRREVQHREHDRAAQRTSPPSTRGRSRPGACRRTARRARAVHDSCASARIRLITPDCSPVQSSDGAGAAASAQRVADRPAARAGRARTAGNRAGGLRSRSARRPAARGRGRPARRRRTAAQVRERHASLNCARSASRARASRDFTVPTAMPSEKPISS